MKLSCQYDFVTQKTDEFKGLYYILVVTNGILSFLSTAKLDICRLRRSNGAYRNGRYSHVKNSRYKI